MNLVTIEYRQCYIEEFKKCESLAKHWAKSDSWQLIYQPTHQANIPLRKLIEENS